MTRKSASTDCVPPKRSKECSWRTRRSFGWVESGNSPISSRNIGPPCALSNFPNLRLSAPESARALEHLCFVNLAALHFSSDQPISKELNRNFEQHFQHDLEKQAEHLEEAKAIAIERNKQSRSPAAAFFDLARHTLATADRMIRQENWYLAHECLRAADAIAKAIDHV